MKVFYDDIDGKLYPKLVLLPISKENEFFLYNLESPFERFYQEDFHDDLMLITVSQGALKQNPFLDNGINIDTEQLKTDLLNQEYDPEAIFHADYFVILIDDLEELLQFEIRRHFHKHN